MGFIIFSKINSLKLINVLYSDETPSHIDLARYSGYLNNSRSTSSQSSRPPSGSNPLMVSQFYLGSLQDSEFKVRLGMLNPEMLACRQRMSACVSEHGPVSVYSYIMLDI
ncbi:MAG: hypothetical protein ACXWFF_06965 [Methylomonas sp.]